MYLFIYMDSYELGMVYPVYWNVVRVYRRFREQVLLTCVGGDELSLCDAAEYCHLEQR